MVKRAFALVVLGLVFAGSGTAGPLAQGEGQKYRLTDKSAPGDSAAVDETFRLELKVKAATGGQDLPEMAYSASEQKAYVATVLATDAKGRPTGLRLKFSRYRTREQEPGEQPVSRTSTAEGKTVTVKRTGGKTVVSTQRGKLAETDRKDLAELLEEVDFDPFPNQPLAVGEEWSLESKELARSFGTEGNARVQGRVIEKIVQAGRPALRLRLEIELDGTLKGESANLSMQLAGDLIYALDLARTLSISLTGPVTLSGEVESDGQSITLSGQGTAAMKLSSRWSRLAGKPVPK